MKQQFARRYQWTHRSGTPSYSVTTDLRCVARFLPASFGDDHLCSVLVKTFPQRSVLEFNSNVPAWLLLQVLNIDKATTGEESCGKARTVCKQRAQSVRLVCCRPIRIVLAIVSRPWVSGVQPRSTSMVICKRKQTIDYTLRVYKSVHNKQQERQRIATWSVVLGWRTKSCPNQYSDNGEDSFAYLCREWNIPQKMARL